jgi:hypothetical protein
MNSSQFVLSRLRFSVVLPLRKEASFNMKILRKVIFICVLYAIQCELQSDLMFKKILSYSLEKKETIKEVFLSMFIEENHLGAVMFCAENGMELLRIETQEEHLHLFRSLKFYWLEFDDDLFIDGIKSDNKKWTFLTNGAEIDQSVLYFLQDENNFSVGDFIKVVKIGTNLKFGVCIENEKKKFLCQKISQNDEQKHLEAYPTGLMKVDVMSRMFEKIGSYESFSRSKFQLNTFFINRNAGGLSYPKGMKQQISNYKTCLKIVLLQNWCQNGIFKVN